MIRFFQLIIFLTIQLILLLLTIVGYIVIAVQVMVYAKNHGISATSTSMLGTRWILHLFGSRQDLTTVKLINAVPFMSTIGLWLIIGPAFITNRLCRYRPSFARLVEPEKASLITITNSRTPLFDKIMEA